MSLNPCGENVRFSVRLGCDGVIAVRGRTVAMATKEANPSSEQYCVVDGLIAPLRMTKIQLSFVFPSGFGGIRCNSCGEVFVVDGEGGITVLPGMYSSIPCEWAATQDHPATTFDKAEAASAGDYTNCA